MLVVTSLPQFGYSQSDVNSNSVLTEPGELECISIGRRRNIFIRANHPIPGSKLSSGKYTMNLEFDGKPSSCTVSVDADEVSASCKDIHVSEWSTGVVTVNAENGTIEIYSVRPEPEILSLDFLLDGFSILSVQDYVPTYNPCASHRKECPVSCWTAQPQFELSFKDINN